MIRPFTGAELENQEYVFLLEVFFAGGVFRFATRAVVVPTQDGRQLPFVGTLPENPFEDEYDLFSDSPRQATASFELDFSVWGVDVAMLEEQGHDMSAATGELSLWVPGHTYEDRVVVLSGRLNEPVSGEADQPVAFSIEQNLFEDGRLFPSARQRISASTWPSAPDTSLNTVYVIPFGTPGCGTNENGDPVAIPGSPAYLVELPTKSAALDSIRLLVAGCHVIEGTVTIHDDHLVDSDRVATEGTGVYRTVRQLVNERDQLNQPCAVVYLDGEGAFEEGAWKASLEGSYWVIWDGSAAGIPNERRTGPMVGAGEIMRFMYQQGSQPIDYGRFAVAEPLLNAYQLSGYIDAEVPPHQWVVDNLSPLLPMSLVNGQEGIYPVVWPMNATEQDAVAHLVLEEDMWRDPGERKSTERENLLNECRLSYLLDGASGDYRVTYTLSGDETTGNATAYHCLLSFKRYGSKTEAITSNLVTSHVTARMVALWRTRAFAFPRRTIRYTLDRKFAGMAIGDVVTLTDVRLHWQRRIVLLTSVIYQNAGPFATFMLVADPVRDTIAMKRSLEWGSEEGELWGEPVGGRWGEP